MKKQPVLFAFAAAASTTLAVGTASANIPLDFHWTGNIGIPDGSGSETPGATASTDIIVNQPGLQIKNLIVGLNVNHTWQGDLRIWLTHVESGQSIYLINRPGRITPLSTFGFLSDNYGDLTGGQQMLFDDTASSVYNRSERGGTVAAPGINNVTGSWLADDTPFEGFGGGNSLSIFNGTDVSGTWRLSAADFAGGDTGSLRTFSLYFEVIPAPGAITLLGIAGLCGVRRRRD